MRCSEPIRDAKFWLTRALNKFSSMSEFSDTQIANSLMGIDSFHTSHTFWSSASARRSSNRIRPSWADPAKEPGRVVVRPTFWIATFLAELG